MEYNVDVTKTPQELVRGLINHENNTNFAAQDMTFGMPSTLGTGKKSLPINIKATDYVFTLQPIDLDGLFSKCGIHLFYTYNTTMYDPEKLIEIQRKYGLATNADDYEIKSINRITHLVATNKNMAYTGQAPIMMYMKPQGPSEIVHADMENKTRPMRTKTRRVVRSSINVTATGV